MKYTGRCKVLYLLRDNHIHSFSFLQYRPSLHPREARLSFPLGIEWGDAHQSVRPCIPRRQKGEDEKKEVTCICSPMFSYVVVLGKEPTFLSAQIPICVRPLDLHLHTLDSEIGRHFVHNGHAIAPTFRKAFIHTVEHSRPVLSFGPTSATLNAQGTTLLVVFSI